jgi:hypothetical protein
MLGTSTEWAGLAYTGFMGGLKQPCLRFGLELTLCCC